VQPKGAPALKKEAGAKKEASVPTKARPVNKKRPRAEMEKTAPKISLAVGGVPTNQLFVGGLGEMSEDTLQDFFSKFGQISAVATVKDKKSGKPRGFGFVTYAGTAAVQAVLDLQAKSGLLVSGTKVANILLQHWSQSVSHGSLIQ
jgi:RNA recognition motif-containing protein